MRIGKTELMFSGLVALAFGLIFTFAFANLADIRFYLSFLLFLVGIYIILKANL